MSIIEAVMSYGALGAVAVYFAFKDFRNEKTKDKVISENTTALSKFTVAIETLTSVIGIHHNVDVETYHE